MTMRRMEAEVVTGCDAEPIIRMLTELRFELEVIVWPDDDGTTVVATKLTDLEEVAFFHHVREIVETVDPEAFLMKPALSGRSPFKLKNRRGETPRCVTVLMLERARPRDLE
jgi:hypothetical protein